MFETKAEVAADVGEMTDRRRCGPWRASQSQTRWCLFGIMTDIEREIHDFSTSVCSNSEPSSKLFFQSCICKHRAVVTSADEVHERITVASIFFPLSSSTDSDMLTLLDWTLWTGCLTTVWTTNVFPPQSKVRWVNGFA